MPLKLFSLILFFSWPLSACDAQQQMQTNGALQLSPAFPALNFSQPVDLQHAGDGSNRLFVVEQAGVVRVFENDPAVTETETFMDIRSRVLSGGEQGLLGLAFHPDFEANGFVFASYTASGPRRSVVSRFAVDPNDPNRAQEGSELVLLEVAQPFGNHNGGQIRFGPDGFLYIALGDGGSGGDPEENGQDPTTLLGAILRLDVDNPSGGRNYDIPSDNPFVGGAGGREEIFAYGLRNPWRFSFDAQTGLLWTGDVGQNRFEEIDVIENGGNYGWDTMEGAHCFEPSSGCATQGLTLPVWEYDHSAGGSVTGGFVYRGAGVPELFGRYIYADFISGRIWALDLDGTDVLGNTELFDTNLGIAAFGVDEANELYLTAFDGRIYRFAEAAATSTEQPDQKKSHLLEPPYPNPFRAATALPYVLAHAAHVEVYVYDLLGRRVRALLDRLQQAGAHRLQWNGLDEAGRRLAPGLYVFEMTVDGERAGLRRGMLLP